MNKRLFPYNLPTMEDVRKAESKKLFTVVSMFAGCGGSSTGYRMAGGNILAANEFMETARSIYSANYPKTLLMPEDIRTLSGEEILKRIGLKKGELDVLDGSPPCAGFSASGLKQEGWGKIKKYSSTNQRVDDLFYEFARVLKEIQPKTFIAENVKGLTLGESADVLGTNSRSLNNFFEFDESFLGNGMNETIIETLRQCGYKVAFKVLDSSHYGVPQKRERLIFIGVRSDLNISPSFPKETTPNNLVLGKYAIYDLLFNGAECKLNEDTKNYWYLKNLFPPHITRQKIRLIKRGKQLKFFEQRFVRSNWNETHKTILQADFSNVFHSIVDRYISIDEAKRVQAFPEDYDLLTPNKKRVLVSLEELENPESLKIHGEYKNENAGEHSGNIKDICIIAGLDYDKLKSEKIFILDFKVDEKRKLEVKGNKSWEFIGRAVPPLLMKEIASHVYNNILLKVNKNDKVQIK